MSKQELLEKLEELRGDDDFERVHIAADKFLIDFINDDEVSEAFDSVGKWYA